MLFDVRPKRGRDAIINRGRGAISNRVGGAISNRGFHSYSFAVLITILLVKRFFHSSSVIRCRPSRRILFTIPR